MAFFAAYINEDNYENDIADMYAYYRDLTHKNEINSLICGEVTCDLEEMGFILIDSLEEYNEINWGQYTRYSIDLVNYDEEMQDISWPVSNIKSLDLSEAIYLEIIEPATLYGGFESETPVNESCTLVENTSRGNYYKCKSNLKSVIFPQNGVLKTIGESSFTNGQLTEVVIPYTVETIGSSAFGNNQITSLVFEDTEENPSRLKILGSDVFCENKIEGVLTIPSAVEEIGGSVFSNNNITKVIIPSSIKKITSGPGYEVFDDNPNLTEIIIKKDGSEPLTHPNNWPSGVTITYNPNYTE